MFNISLQTLLLIILMSVFPGESEAQDFFWLGPYSPRLNSGTIGAEGTIAQAAKDNFNVGGLQYSPAYYASELDACISNGLSVVYRMWPRRTVTDKSSPKYHGEVGTRVYVANVNAAGDDEVADASDEQIAVWVKQIEDEVKNVVANEEVNNVLIGWYLIPEEVRPWKPQELKLLEGMYNAVKTYDPKKRYAFMYNPQHSDAERLINMNHCIDIWTIGAYPHGWKNDHKRLQIKHALTQMVEANKQLTTPKPVIPALEMMEEPNNPYDAQDVPLIPTFVRHDAYAAVANGADGILIWSMGKRDGFTNYITYYNAWAQFSKETYNLGLREVFNKGAVQDRASYEITKGRTSVMFYINDTNYSYSPVSIREWDYNDESYLLVVNSDDFGVDVKLENLNAASYWNLFVNESYTPVGGELSFSLPAYGVIFLSTKKSDYTSVEEAEEPSSCFTLYQNYPNPFNPYTRIDFRIPKEGFVTFKVYDSSGREVARLVNEHRQAGTHFAELNTLNSPLTSGIYYYTLQSGTNIITKKMVLLK